MPFHKPLLLILVIGNYLTPALGFQAVQKHKHKACTIGYTPGVHLVQLPDIKRQFLLAVPNEPVDSPAGVPLVMTFHGFSDSPWYVDATSGMSRLTNRYGWVGILPFGMDLMGTNGLGGVEACCPPGCTGDCCKQGLQLSEKDEHACGWLHDDADTEFTEALIQWASEKACVDRSKVFGTGFSNGAMFLNHLACKASQLFRAVAPISGDFPHTEDNLCEPARAISYISICGSADDEAHCQETFEATAKHWSELSNCTGAGPAGAPVTTRKSATTTCTEWHACEGGNFVEVCKGEGLSHDISGHLRPDDTSYLRPGTDLDFPQYAFQKFSLLAEKSILFYGHPTPEELEYKQSVWPPPKHVDHIEFRRDV